MRVAVENLFRRSSFDICAVRDLMTLTGAPAGGQAFELLRALHCVEYARMPEELQARIPHLVNECLRPPVSVSEAVDTVLAGVEAAAP